MPTGGDIERSTWGEVEVARCDQVRPGVVHDKVVAAEKAYGSWRAVACET